MIIRSHRALNLKGMLNWEQSKLINLYRFRDGYSLAPAVVVFALTYRCNLDCKMCPQARSRVEFREKWGEELPFGQLKKAIDHLPDFPWKSRIHLTGGEPLLYRDFVTLIEYLREQKFPWSMTTNGFILEKFAKAIVENGIRHLNVSIDGPENIHDKIRRVPHSFQNAMKGIQAVKRIREERRYKYPKITVNCAIQPDNFRYLEDAIHCIENSGAEMLTLEHFFFSAVNRWSMEMVKNIDVSFLKDQMIKIKAAHYSIQVTFFPKIKFSDIKGYYTNISYNFGNSCIAPWLITRVTPDGNLMPCPEAKIMGNLVEQPLREIWNSTKFKNFRTKLKKNGIFKGTTCDRCCHRQYYVHRPAIS